MFPESLPEKAQIMRCSGNAIRVFREARGLTQSQLADKASVDRAYLHNMEAGKHSPTITCLWKIAWALEVSPAKMIARMENTVDDASD